MYGRLIGFVDSLWHRITASAAIDIRRIGITTTALLQSTMEKAIVRMPANDEKLYIHFRCRQQQHNLQRSRDETLNRTLVRIGISSNNKKHKKKDKHIKQAKEESALQVLLLDKNGNRIDDSLVSSMAWSQASVLKIGEDDYSVEVNPPNVVSLTLPDVVMAEFPVIPILQTEFTDKVKFEWLIATHVDQDSVECLSKSEIIASNDRQVSTFKPQVNNIGSLLKLVCTPYNAEGVAGKKMSVRSKSITAGPGVCPFDNIHSYTKKQLNDPSYFRLVSYNILADTYASSDHTQKVLFPYCPAYALHIDYRKQLIVKELLGYNADIICLQECDKIVFDQFFAPVMSGLGYDCIHDAKAANYTEGEAILYRHDRFDIIDRNSIRIAKVMQEDGIYPKIQQVPALNDILLSRNSIVQILVLQPKKLENVRLVVVNTHLYFRHNASHVRLIQGYCMLNYVKQYCERFQDYDVRCVYCGDFNSNPRSAFVQLMTSGYVDSNHAVWHQGGETESCDSLSLRTDQKFISFTSYPQFTNFVGGFVECLDYIFGKPEHLQVEQVLPTMGAEEAAAHIALPSVVSPSDHVPIGCDLRIVLS